MKTSDHINELAAALAKAQGEMKNAHLNKVNPHFKSKFADLAAVRDAVIPFLAKHGIATAQATGAREGGFCVVTRLIHSSGQWLESEYPIVLDPAKPQVMGSAMSYARRYSLSAIGCIASEEDDDGNNATKGNGNSKLSQIDDIKSDHGAAPDPDEGVEGLTRHASKKIYEQMLGEMRAKAAERDSVAFRQWALERKDRIAAMHPNFRVHLRTEFAETLATIKAGEEMDGKTEEGSQLSPLKQQLKGSLSL